MSALSGGSSIEAAVAGLFVVVAAAAVTGPAWLLVLGFTGHGLKDLWQHHPPPLCRQHPLVATVLPRRGLSSCGAAGRPWHRMRPA
jgi:hypothetical protein